MFAGLGVCTPKFNEVSLASRVDCVKLNVSCLSGSDQRPHLLSWPSVPHVTFRCLSVRFYNTNPICSLVLHHCGGGKLYRWNELCTGFSFTSPRDRFYNTQPKYVMGRNSRGGIKKAQHARDFSGVLTREYITNVWTNQNVLVS